MANELRFLDGDLLFVGGDLAMSADCCCEEGTVYTIECLSNLYTFPDRVTVDFGSITGAGCCATGIGGVRTLFAESGPAIIGGPTRVSMDWSLCDDSAPPPCGFGNTEQWRLNLFVPCDGSDMTAVAGTRCGGSEVLWRSTTLPHQFDFTSWSTTLPLDGAAGCTPPATVSVNA